MLQLILGFVLGAVAAAVCFTSGFAQRIYDYASAYDYSADYTAPAVAPEYSAPVNGATEDGTASCAQEPATAYQTPAAPYQARTAAYPGAASGYVNGVPLNVSVVPAPALPGGDNSCSAYALSNRTNQAIVISYADGQGGSEAASDRGLLVQPGETKVHTVAAFDDRQRRQRDENADREDRYSYGDPLHREGPSSESPRGNGGDDGANAATCATIEVKN